LEKIHQFENSFQLLDDEKLRRKTDEFRERHKRGESLDALLPEAFAAVVNVCRRLQGKTFCLCGQQRQWDMIPYDEQLMGAIAIHRSKIAEMATGEGKTLVAALPLYLNALAGENCRLVTVNDYLARRDAEWMSNIYGALGLRVGCIQNTMGHNERKAAYGCDITYGTASEFGFDYLRDNGLAISTEEQVQRGHYFCIVDEIDSVLIDEARTPLVISGPIEENRLAPFQELCPAVQRLATLQLQLCNRLTGEAKESLARNAKDQLAIKKLYQVRLGMPKHRQLLKLLETNAVERALERLDVEMDGEMQRHEKRQLQEELYFTVEEKNGNVDLTELGRKTLYPENPDAFVLPDLPTIFAEIDRQVSLDEQQKLAQKQEIAAQSENIGERIHCIGQLLRAHTLFEKDQHYIVRDNQIIIVDPHTGRAMEGRRWSDGLHQAIEAKEGLEVRRENRTFASITVQNYFRMYEKLAGMTGTAETEAQEFHDIYGLSVVIIPTHRPCIRHDENDSIYKTRREKYAAIVRDIEEAHRRGQPVLVGTTSVESSELMDKMLSHNRLPHTVLNAKFHEMEANIVAKAGEIGAITVATNMAGRGTDIRLGEGVAALGGLKVLGTERHESRRIDRQLRGRCARQGDPGSSKFYVSLEDDLMRLFASRGPVAAILESTFREGDVLAHPLLNRSIARAQKKVEMQNYAVRKRLLEYDDVLNQQREVIYCMRNEVLRGDNVRTLISEFIDDFVAEILAEEQDSDADAKFFSSLTEKMNKFFPLWLTVEDWKNLKPEQWGKFFCDRIRGAHALMEKTEGTATMHLLERIAFFRAIDLRWQQHLSTMENLRRSVGLRAYAQKNPLYEYKTEAFMHFEQLLKLLRRDVLLPLFRSASSEESLRSIWRQTDHLCPSVPAEQKKIFMEISPLRRTSPQIDTTGRNEPCPCGSGKKYKKCCGKE
jgi:preprotein translocase subunit SecA